MVRRSRGWCRYLARYQDRDDKKAVVGVAINTVFVVVVKITVVGLWSGRRYRGKRRHLKIPGGSQGPRGTVKGPGDLRGNGGRGAWGLGRRAETLPP